MDVRSCKECGSRLRGRTDKKFCNDNCRNSFHNRRNGHSTALIREINYILRKNRKILREFKSSGQGMVHRNLLDSKGFDFNYFTNTVLEEGEEVYYCYEEGYKPLTDDYFSLIKR